MVTYYNKNEIKIQIKWEVFNPLGWKIVYKKIIISPNDDSFASFEEIKIIFINKF